MADRQKTLRKAGLNLGGPKAQRLHNFMELTIRVSESRKNLAPDLAYV
jgi:hypothetical protein